MKFRRLLRLKLYAIHNGEDSPVPCSSLLQLLKRGIAFCQYRPEKSPCLFSIGYNRHAFCNVIVVVMALPLW